MSRLHNRWVLMASLYTTQYLAMGFLMVALVAILRQQGATLTELSGIYLLGLPWVFKFLWAPLVDRIHFGKRGHYRIWILLLQALMVAGLLLMSQLSLADDFDQIIGLGLLFILLSATQDIATDALACTLFSHAERGAVNGLQTGAGLLGNIIGGGLVLMLYPRIGWQGAFYLMAALTSISWVQMLLANEPAKAVAAGQTVCLAATFRRLLRFWHGRGGWLAMLLIYPLGLSLSFGILTPLLIDRHWAIADVGMLLNVYGSLVGMLASLLAARLILRFGRVACLRGFALLQLLGLLLMLPLTLAQSGHWQGYLAVSAYFVFYPCTAALLSTLMMDKASQGNTPGTDYTLQFSMYLMTGFFMSSLAVLLADLLGYPAIIGLSLLGALLALLMSWRPQGLGQPGPEQPLMGVN